MKQILVYSDSLSWGIIPSTRKRLPFWDRWPGVLETVLNKKERQYRVIENCLNGRRTVWEDPVKPGRNGLEGVGQVIEMHSPLELVILMLGTNDFQSMHSNRAIDSAKGIRSLITAIRQAPVEPGMPVPPVLLVAPAPIQNPKGAIADKFKGAATKCQGLASNYEQVAIELGCAFFNSADVISISEIDGVHLDKPQHQVLGSAIANKVIGLPDSFRQI